MLTADQGHDRHGGHALLASVPPMRQLIADTACDANDPRDFFAAQDTKTVISPNPRRPIRPASDAATCKARHLIERAFCQLKNWRAGDTRYNKTARNPLASVRLAVAVTNQMQWSKP